MYSYIKRFFDFIFSLLGLIIISPLLIPIMIALLLTGEHYVFYFQKRVGYKNSFFDIWKFATMLKNSPNMGTGSLTVRNDPRVTPVGKYLRKSKVNELPQLFNVLLGNMSFVGPRPQMKVDFEAYPEHVKASIYDTQPGITGIGSIFFRDEEKYLSETELPPKEFYKIHIAPYKGELELWYLENQSFVTDFKLLFLTFWVILFPNQNYLEKWFKGLPSVPEKLQTTNPVNE
ncbi:MAG: sugar transferase [Bacteroidota bacterium]